MTLCLIRFFLYYFGTLSYYLFISKVVVGRLFSISDKTPDDIVDKPLKNPCFVVIVQNMVGDWPLNVNLTYRETTHISQ